MSLFGGGKFHFRTLYNFLYLIQYILTGGDYNPNPWYIYECVPFIKDLKGYDEISGSQNKLLENFIKQMNKKPLDLVDEFLTNDKSSSKSTDQCGTTAKNSDTSKGIFHK